MGSGDPHGTLPYPCLLSLLYPTHVPYPHPPMLSPMLVPPCTHECMSTPTSHCHMYVCVYASLVHTHSHTAPPLRFTHHHLIHSHPPPCCTSICVSVCQCAHSPHLGNPGMPPPPTSLCCFAHPSTHTMASFTHPRPDPPDVQTPHCPPSPTHPTLLCLLSCHLLLVSHPHLYALPIPPSHCCACVCTLTPHLCHLTYPAIVRAHTYMHL
jgi:hypothetical protein